MVYLRPITRAVIFFTLTLTWVTGAQAQAPLLDGFGGALGYGADTLVRNDDESTTAIDLTPAFPAGVNFYGLTHTTAYVNNNGNITFNGAVSTYTPDPFPISDQPMLAAFWGDVDTRGTTGVGAEENLVYYEVDATGGRLVATYYLVGYFNSATDLLNSFQIIVTDRSDIAPGDFDFEYRYNRLEWTTGDFSGGIGGLGGTEAQMGFDAGNLTDNWSHPDSQTPAILDLVTTSNVGEPGVWRFSVRSGAPTVCGDGILSGDEECDDGNTEGNDGCTGCIIYPDADSDGFYDDVDCDDTRGEVNPAAPEICDGLDNDCDGSPGAIEIDDDGDGFTECDGDCDDFDAEKYPGAPELCNGADENCDDIVPPDEADSDADGVRGCEGDCDDSNSMSFPGAEEICDGLDNDCDEVVPDDEVDVDGDGFSACENDCDETDDTIHPDAEERCDGVDTNCDGTLPADELDADGDGYLICQRL